MPLTIDEVILLADDAADLYTELAAALRKDADGKVRLTRKEREKVGKMALALASKLLTEAVD